MFCQWPWLSLSLLLGWWWWYHSLTAHQHKKSHTVPKHVIMIATSIQVAYIHSLSTALCESIRYQVQSEQNVQQDPIPRGDTWRLLSCCWNGGWSWCTDLGSGLIKWGVTTCNAFVAQVAIAGWTVTRWLDPHSFSATPSSLCWYRHWGSG